MGNDKTLCRVTLPADGKHDYRNIAGLGVFLRGKPREVELSKAQAESLKNKQFSVITVKPKADKE